MTSETIEVDYLIVGAGAMGIAFADGILNETNATIAIVDKNDKPGGHWNHAYPFVKLHQPSAYYGVNSKKLGSDYVDQIGRNKGLLELASSSEILGYFDQVMRQNFLPSGRVQYFPQCEYQGDGAFRSNVSGKTYAVNAKKIVDSTYMNVKVPSIDPPKFEVADGVDCVPPNGLAEIKGKHDKFVIVGAGKTAVDAILYLMDLGVDPDALQWIMPRDSWFLDRANVQPDGYGPVSVLDSIGLQLQSIATSTSVDDMFAKLEATGGLMRIDENVKPTMYRCATISRPELEDIKRIKNVLRKGRVQRIDANAIVMDGGTVPFEAGTLFVNCTSDGLEKRPSKPIFEGNTITLQAVRPCQQLFSAAFIGHVEAAYDDDDMKNMMCTPTPHPNTAIDYLQVMNDILVAQVKWAQDSQLLQWLIDSRLDGVTPDNFAELMDPINQPPEGGMMELTAFAMQKIGQYLSESAPAE